MHFHTFAGTCLGISSFSDESLNLNIRQHLITIFTNLRYFWKNTHFNWKNTVAQHENSSNLIIEWGNLKFSISRPFSLKNQNPLRIRMRVILTLIR